MKLAIVVSVIVLDCAQHSSRIALCIHGNQDPLEEDMLICVFASTYFTVECVIKPKAFGFPRFISNFLSCLE